MNDSHKSWTNSRGPGSTTEGLRFKASEWRVTPSGGEPLANPVEVAHWDYATNLSIERTLSVAIEIVRTQALLDSWVPVTFRSKTRNLFWNSVIHEFNEMSTKFKPERFAFVLKSV